MKQEIKIVIGALFGDEGKGNITQWLCNQALNNNKTVAVVRFSGGPQAAHRIVNNHRSHICSSYGSGSLLGVPTLWINPNNTFIDPIAVMLERESFIKEGIEVDYPQLLFKPEETRWITPYDIIANQLNEKVLTDGSCGKGIYTTFKRYLKECPNNDPESILAYASDYWNIERDNYLDRKFKQCYYQLLSRQRGLSLDNYEVLVYEGSQGLLLDMESEYFPNVTPSHTDLSTITNVLCNPNTEIYFCSRVYNTRHGNGYNPVDPESVDCFYTIEDICNPPNKYQGTMKYGLLELSLFKTLRNIDTLYAEVNMVFTHCDKIKNKMVYIDEYGDTHCKSLESFAKMIKDNFVLDNVYGSFSDKSNSVIKLQ